MSAPRFAVIAALTVAGLLGGCAAYGPSVAGEKFHRNLVYSSPGRRDLRLDLYVPKSARPVPVVIWVFGGSWRYGKRGYHVNLRDLPRSGIALACIDYRFSDEAKYPAQLEDLQAALRWLRTRGPAYGLDPQRIGVSGESAGGHLAALLGTVEGRDRVRAVCALYPPTDLVKIGEQYASSDKPSDIERLLGGPIERLRPQAAAASPVTHVSAKSPPFYLIHGARDKLVPPSHSVDLHRRLRAAGVPSKLVLLPEKEHWFLLTDAQHADIARFFQTHFKLAR